MHTHLSGAVRSTTHIVRLSNISKSRRGYKSDLKLHGQKAVCLRQFELLENHSIAYKPQKFVSHRSTG